MKMKDLMDVQAGLRSIDGSGRVPVFDSFSVKFTSNFSSDGTLGLNKVKMRGALHFLF